MPEREAVAFFFLALSLLWIVWVDARPRVKLWWGARKRLPLETSFPPEINSDGKYGSNKRSITHLPMDEKGSEPVSVTTYFIDLTNTTPKTIRNVHVQLIQIDNPIPCPIGEKLRTKDDAFVVDITPGYTELFKLGRLIRYGDDFTGETVQLCDSEFADRLKASWPDHIGLQLLYGEGKAFPLVKNDRLRLVLGVFGDDIKSVHHLFTLDLKDGCRITYGGQINPDEPLGPRRPPGTGA